MNDFNAYFGAKMELVDLGIQMARVVASSDGCGLSAEIVQPARKIDGEDIHPCSIWLGVEAAIALRDAISRALEARKLLRREHVYRGRVAITKAGDGRVFISSNNYGIQWIATIENGEVVPISECSENELKQAREGWVEYTTKRLAEGDQLKSEIPF